MNSHLSDFVKFFLRNGFICLDGVPHSGFNVEFQRYNGLLHTRWNDKDFLFAMNGQTGKLIGDLPVDPKRVAAWFAGISLPLMVILALFLYG